MKDQGRTGLKWWNNAKKGDKWTIRIRWFEAMDEDDIRLSMEDSQGQRNFFPNDREHARKVWKLFQEQAPTAPDTKPFVAKFIEQIQKGT